MRATIVVATLLAFAAAGVQADTLPALVPAAAGERVHLRVTRTLQGLDAPQIATADVVVQRKSDDALVLERRGQDGAIVDSVLTLGTNGTLQLAASERNTSSDADVRALLPILNAALAVTQGAAPPVWSASLAVPVGQENAPTTIAIPLRATNVAGSDYDVSGSGTTALEGGQNGGAQQGERRRSSFAGGPGGGFGGGLGSVFGGRGAGGGGRGQSSDAGNPSPAPDAPNAMTLLVRVTGHVSGGRMHRLSIAQTREIQVGGAPFVNESSWTIDVLRAPDS